MKAACNAPKSARCAKKMVCAAPENQAGTKKPPEGGFDVLLTAHPLQTAGSLRYPCCLPEVGQAASARAFTLAARRLLSRAALFLWKMPLSATVSTTLCALAKASAAFTLSPARTAFSTFLTAVRYLERSDVLAALILTS